MKWEYVVPLALGSALASCGDDSITLTCAEANARCAPGIEAGSPLADATVPDSAMEASAGTGDDVNASPDGSPSDAGVDAAMSTAQCVTAVLGPAGGSILHPAGASMTVPVGALGAETRLSICPDPTSIAGAAGPAFQMGPEGQTFLQPVVVTLPLDGRFAPGANPTAIQVAMAPAGSSTFVPLVSMPSLPTQTVTTSTAHFTQFAPAVTATPIFITSPAALAGATSGAAYSQTFVASGGTTPYQWSIAGGALPAGLTMSAGGVLSGTPSVTGTFVFFALVEDADGDSVEMATSLTVSPASNPVPALNQVQPASAAQGSGDTVVTVAGSEFVPASQVTWDGTALATTVVSPTQLAATIPAADLANTGSHFIGVTNPAPGGGSSGTIAFAVVPAGNPVPSIASVSPGALPIASNDVQVTISGTDFIANTVAEIGSETLATSVQSGTQLLATVPAADVAAAGTLVFAVFNPAPGGGLSPQTVGATVAAANPVPVLTSMTPSTLVAGSGNLVDLTGTGFVPATQVFAASLRVASSYVSATEIQALVIPAGVGTYSLSVTNPEPGGGSSSSLSYTAAAPEGGVDGGAGIPCMRDDSSSRPEQANCPVSEICQGVYPTWINGTCVIPQYGACPSQDGAPCGDIEGQALSCVPGACGGTVCALLGAPSTTQCTFPGTELSYQPCAAGYVCDLGGQYEQIVPGCGAVVSDCQLQVGLGQPCYSDYDTIPKNGSVCGPGLACTGYDADGGSVCAMSPGQ
jgi:hypothetical protein